VALVLGIAAGVDAAIQGLLDLFDSGSGSPFIPNKALVPPHTIQGNLLGAQDVVLTQHNEEPRASLTLKGGASWYLPTGNPTKSGEAYEDPEQFIAAMHHDIVGPRGRFPYGTTATVTYRPPGWKMTRSVNVRVIDQGPGIKGRIIDLSPGAWKALTGKTAGGPDDPGVVTVTVALPGRADETLP
jgi:Lytic transglycolase